MTLLSTLGLGLRLGLGGGRQAIGRMLLTAAAVALAVGLVLSAIGVFSAQRDRDRRMTLRGVIPLEAGDRVPDDRLLFAYPGPDRLAGQPIRQTLVAAIGDPPIPPWFRRLPSLGEMVVSPALADVLSSSEGVLLRPRYPQRIIQLLDPAWLMSPDELVAYVGADPSRMPRPAIVVGFATDPDGFGPTSPPSSRNGTRILPLGGSSPGGGRSLADRLEDPFFQAVLLAAIGLAGPIIVLIATATRLSAAAREARLAAIRLVGGTPHQVRVAAAGESLIAAVAGSAAGFIFFIACRPVLARSAPDGSRWFTSVVAVSPRLSAILLVGVPLLAVAISVMSLRRIVLTPLGIVHREGRTIHGRWRVASLAAGFGVFVLIMIAGEWIFDRRRGAIPVAIVAGGFGLVTVGTAAVAPLIGVSLAASLRRATGGLGSLLGSRRLESDPRSAGRIVAGLVVVVFAVAVAQTFASAYAAQEGDRVPVSLRSSILRIRAQGVEDLPSRVNEIPGISAALPVWVATVSSPGYENEALVFDCHQIAEIVTARVPPCEADAVYLPWNATGRPSVTRLTIRFGQGVQDHIEPLHVVRTPIGLGSLEGVHVPVSALSDNVIEGVPPTYVLAATRRGAVGEQLIRNAFPGFAGSVEISTAGQIRRRISPVTEEYIPRIEAGVELGTLLVLAIAVSSMLVATIDGIIERRRSLATMAAAGTPSSVLRRAVTIEVVVPFLGGVLLAVTASIIVTRMFFAVGQAPLADGPTPIPIGPIARVLLFALVAAILSAVTTFPAISRALRPDSLRAE
jgi:hypothetical protein